MISAADVTLKTTNIKHIGVDNVKVQNNDPVPNFAQALNEAFEKVNHLELKSEDLQLKMVTDPDSVNTHDVSIAQTQAELALSFTKAISSRLVSGFNELTNLR